LARWARRPPMPASAITVPPVDTMAPTIDSSPRPAAADEKTLTDAVAMAPARAADPALPLATASSGISRPPSSRRVHESRSSTSVGGNGPGGETVVEHMEVRENTPPKDLPGSAPSSEADSPVLSSGPVLPYATEPASPAQTGYATFKSLPPFARIFVDGKAAGTTPVKIPLTLSAGNHELILEKEGCLPLHASFAIRPGETREFRYTLETTDKLP
jgi:hypothetical protein